MLRNHFMPFVSPLLCGCFRHRMWCASAAWPERWKKAPCGERLCSSWRRPIGLGQVIQVSTYSHHQPTTACLRKNLHSWTNDFLGSCRKAKKLSSSLNHCICLTWWNRPRCFASLILHGHHQISSFFDGVSRTWTSRVSGPTASPWQPAFGPWDVLGSGGGRKLWLREWRGEGWRTAYVTKIWH